MSSVTNQVATFFEDIGFGRSRKDRGGGEYRRDILRTMELHDASFTAHGWQVVRVGLAEARQHPLYDWFDRLDGFYALSRNAANYTRLCYMRWLAYAISGLPFADLDVINFGFTPEDARPFIVGTKPAINSAANAMGLLSPAHYAQILDAYRHVIENVDAFRGQVEDINDMTLLRAARPDFNQPFPYQDDRFVKDYPNPGWETSLLVHFAHGLTPMPRSRTIEEVLRRRSAVATRAPTPLCDSTGDVR